MAAISATEIAVMTNAIIDLIITLKKVGVTITPENIFDKVAERQAEVDELDKKVNS